MGESSHGTMGLLPSCVMPCQPSRSGAMTTYNPTPEPAGIHSAKIKIKTKKSSTNLDSIGWPIFWVCMGEGAQVSISQAGQMETHGIPNDLIKSANPIAYVVFGLLVQKLLYPFLQKRKIAFRAVNRITLGFLIMSVAMAYSAALQGVIYHTGPCYSHPLACEASDGGQIPNRIHVLWQLPTFIIIALAEVFCWPTGSEYTYSHAPKSMKSILQACYIGTAGLGYLLGMALSPLARDPLLLILWSLVAGLMFVTACAFRVAFRKY